MTLTLTTYDEEGSFGAALVQHFVDQVKEEEPSITITPQFEGAPHEPDAVTAVSNGSADLVMVASRAFDTAGVTTLQALNTPFLIDSNALANAVATSEHVPDLLAGLGGHRRDRPGDRPGGHAPPVRRRRRPRSPYTTWRVRPCAHRSRRPSGPCWQRRGRRRSSTTPVRYDVAESQFDQLTLNKAAGNVTLFAKYDVIGINEKAAQEAVARSDGRPQEGRRRVDDLGRGQRPERCRHGQRVLCQRRRDRGCHP